MNTVALVESPAGSARFAYLVALTSNVPCTDSSLLHRQVATGLQQVIEERHPQLRAQGLIRDPQIVEIKYLLPEK